MCLHRSYRWFVMGIMFVLLISGCTASRNLSRGIGYMQVKNFDDAILSFNRSIEASPEFSEPYYHRGNAWALKKNYEKALADFSRAIELNPDYADAYLGRATVKVEQGQDEQAMTDLNRALESDPHLFNAYILRGLLHKKKGDLKAAADDFTKSVNVKGSDPYLGYMNRGIVYKDLGETNRALSDFSRAINRSPRDPSAYILRAEIRLNQKHYDDAIEDSSLALRLFPLATQAYRIRGDALMAKQDFYLAIWNYGEAIDIDSTDASLYSKRAMAWANIGKTDNACQDFKQSCKLADCRQADFREWMRQNCR